MSCVRIFETRTNLGKVVAMVRCCSLQPAKQNYHWVWNSGRRVENDHECVCVEMFDGFEWFGRKIEVRLDKSFKERAGSASNVPAVNARPSQMDELTSKMQSSRISSASSQTTVPVLAPVASPHSASGTDTYARKVQQDGAIEVKSLPLNEMGSSEPILIPATRGSGTLSANSYQQQQQPELAYSTSLERNRSFHLAVGRTSAESMTASSPEVGTNSPLRPLPIGRRMTAPSRSLTTPSALNLFGLPSLEDYGIRMGTGNGGAGAGAVPGSGSHGDMKKQGTPSASVVEKTESRWTSFFSNNNGGHAGGHHAGGGCGNQEVPRRSAPVSQQPQQQPPSDSAPRRDAWSLRRDLSGGNAPFRNPWN